MTSHKPPTFPAIVVHLGAYLRAKTKLSPEICLNDNEASVTVSTGDRHLMLVFRRRRQRWLVRRFQVKRGDEITSFTQGALAKAIAALLGRETPTNAQPGLSGTSRPRTDAMLRERRNTVIRV